MENELECEKLAKISLQVYVNGCACNSPEEVFLAIQKMLAVSMGALEVVKNGKMDIVQ